MRHGFLLIDKPVGPTSHDCVGQVRRTLGERKVGHLGTLDPAASGLLVCAVGAKALKVVEFFGNLSKEYEAEIMLGAVSTTYDREGVIEEMVLKPGVSVPQIEDVNRVIKDRFVGKVSQVPPAYSAVKVGGERAYRKMRQGKDVQLAERTVEIRKCDVVSFEYPSLTLHIACGSGTYIRSLAHDMGQELRCGGYLRALRRTSVGQWSVDNGKLPEEVKWSDVMPLKEVLVSFPRVDLSEEDAIDLCNGRNVPGEVERDIVGWFDGLPVAILEPAERGIHARKVL